LLSVIERYREPTTRRAETGKLPSTGRFRSVRDDSPAAFTASPMDAGYTEPRRPTGQTARDTGRGE
jgi:hypothetical protein